MRAETKTVRKRGELKLKQYARLSKKSFFYGRVEKGA